MSKFARRPVAIFQILAALLCAVSMWVFVQRVLIMHQISDAAATGSPRGNLSDLYPRWLGARELLLHGRDPYSPAVTREIQAGYYGRPLDPSRPSDPKDQQAFAYPVYVVFYLAPTVTLPFELVKPAFFWVLIFLTIVSTLLWLRTLRWQLICGPRIAIIVLTLGSIAVVQGLKLEQLTLIVAVLIAAAIALLLANYPATAGVVLALATIKPQVLCGLLVWIAIWTLGDWRRRYRLAVGFLVTLAALVIASEFLLPHWISRFWHAMHDYLNYTDGASIMDRLLPQPLNRLAELALAAVVTFTCWNNRKGLVVSREFASTTCLVLAATLLLIPSYALYNQVLLLPAILLLARERRALWNQSRLIAIFMGVSAFLLVWQWMASLVIAILSFVVSPALTEKLWAVPLWTMPILPIAVTGLILLLALSKPLHASQGSIPA